MVREESLPQVFSLVPDSRQRRGSRHPMSGMLFLVFLEQLARIWRHGSVSPLGQGSLA